MFCILWYNIPVTKFTGDDVYPKILVQVKSEWQPDLTQKLLVLDKRYEVSIKEKIPERIMGIATKKDIPMSTAAQRFIELIED